VSIEKIKRQKTKRNAALPDPGHRGGDPPQRLGSPPSNYQADPNAGPG